MNIEIEIEGRKGQEKMAQSVLEQVSEKVAETAHEASRAASAVKDSIEDGVIAARRAARKAGYAATELLDDTKCNVRRHPIETVLVTFAAGIAAGTLVGWMMKRKPCAGARESV